MKILLVDDHEMVRLGLKSYFDLQDDVEVVGEAANGSQGIDLALELRPDVIVMDIVMPEMNGIDATLAILKEWPEAKILIVTSYLDNEKIMPVLMLVLGAICSRLLVPTNYSMPSVRWLLGSWPLSKRSARRSNITEITWNFMRT